jgi:hypothetical protein
MTRNQLIQQVALRMDEITPDAGLNITVDGSDNNPLYELIDGVLDDGVLELFSSAPYWRLPQKRFSFINDEISIDAITEGGRKIIRLKLADDFLRVAEIDYPGVFQRPITEVVPEQTPEGRRQHNPYLMGREAKPVGVLSYGVWEGDVNCREIDCYSLPASHEGTGSAVVASYIAKPAAIASTGSNAVEAVVPQVLIPCLEWMVAYLTFSARGDVNHATVCRQNAQNLLV